MCFLASYSVYSNIPSIDHLNRSFDFACANRPKEKLQITSSFQSSYLKSSNWLVFKCYFLSGPPLVLLILVHNVNMLRSLTIPAV